MESREAALWEYIERKIVQICNIRAEMMVETEWCKRYKRLNRDGGELIKRQKSPHQEIVTELLRRTRTDFSRRISPDIGNVAQATKNDQHSSNGGNTNVPDSYRLRDDGGMTIRERADELGIRKPTPNEKRITARTSSTSVGTWIQLLTTIGISNGIVV